MESAVSVDTVTILFTDIEGSTSLWVDHPREAGRALAIHDELLTESVESHHGTIVKTTGDGVLAVFRSIHSGIEAAVAAQLALAGHAADLLNAARVRMGLHVGVVERRFDDYFGLAINECQRLMSMGHAGQILMSEVAYRLLRDDLPPGYTVKDLGLQQLRGIPDPARIFQLVHPRLEVDFPPIGGPEPARHGLPSQLTSFVGREAELSRILALIPQHRLVTLTGPGGTGKTRLAIEVSQHSEDLFPDGVWMVELANISDPSLVARHTAAALSLEESPGKGDVAAIKEFLSPRTALLIMDNCEHLIEAVAVLVQDLLGDERGLTILATSRERLRVPGEAVFPVPPLHLPPESAGEEAAGYDSIQLFVDRAGLAQPGFALTPGNASALIQIARRLDGIPLALELAAAQISVMSPAQIADHLDHRLGLLTGGARTALPRQQTLQAAIDWSYDRLGLDEQTLFARLAVFVDGFDLAAAEQVGGWGLSRPGSLLFDLVEKSLVAREPDHEGRYTLLETMREYAFDRLHHLDETDANRRHAEHFAALLEGGSGRMFGPMQAGWLDQLSLDYHNVLAALSWATGAGDADLLLRLAAPTWSYWLLRGPASEGREWLGKALEMNGDPGELRAVALLGAGTLAANQGDIDEAEALLGEATTIPGAGRATAGAAMAGLAGLAHKKGDLVEASSLFREALSLTRLAGDDWSTGHILASLALLLEDRGEHDEAQALATEGVELARKTGNPDLVGDALLTAGEIAINRDDRPLAKQLLQEALELGQSTGLGVVDAWARVYLGKVACREGELRAGRVFLEEGLELFEDLSYPMGSAWALRNLARIEEELGEARGAGDSLAEALRLAQLYVRPEVPLVLQAMGELGTHQGDLPRAAVLLTAARRLGDRLGVSVPGPDRLSLEECWSTIESKLGESELQSLIARGQALDLDEAVAFALGESG